VAISPNLLEMAKMIRKRAKQEGNTEVAGKSLKEIAQSLTEILGFRPDETPLN
jgi:hypothetical protein